MLKQFGLHGTPERPEPPAIIGHLDAFEPPHTLVGWAACPALPGRALEIVATRDEDEIGRTTANIFRPDLANHGHGACAFHLQTDQPISEAEIAAGRLRLWVTRDDARIAPLAIPAHILARCTLNTALATAIATIRDATDAELDQMIAGFQRSPSLQPHLRDLRTLTAGLRTDAVPTIAADTAPTDSLSPLLLPVGTVATDDSAVIGKRGFVYLTGGSNNVLALMNEDPNSPIVLERAAGWVSLFRQRAARLAGTRFIQLIIPEKLSVLPHFYPAPITTPSPVLAKIEQLAGREATLRGRYHSVYDWFSAAPQTTYRKTDSHLTPQGAFLLFSQILQAIGKPAPDPRVFEIPRVRQGDMALRFFGVPFFDVVLESADGLPPPDLVRQFPPANGRHVDSNSVWRNPRASYQEKVVIFGNSFFNPGGQEGSFWWLSRFFGEIHFLWNPAFDYEYIAAERPDLVIGQTVERFLSDRTGQHAGLPAG